MAMQTCRASEATTAFSASVFLLQLKSSAQKTTTKAKAKAKAKGWVEEGGHHGRFLVVTGALEKKAKICHEQKAKKGEEEEVRPGSISTSK